MEFKNLETQDLTVRFLNVDDTESIYQLSLEPSLGKWMPDQAYKSKGEAAEVVQYLTSQYTKPVSPDQRPFVVGVAIRKTGELIGHVGLSPLDNKVEIGYAISDKYCGKGFATQAVTAMSQWALGAGLKNITGIVACENIGSLKVLEKSNYVLVKEELRPYIGKNRVCREFQLEKPPS